MNSKLCKKLRRQAKALGDSTKDFLAKSVGRGRVIIMNDPDSFRGAYRALKRAVEEKKFNMTKKSNNYA